MSTHYGQTGVIQRHKAIKETIGWEGETDELTSAKGAAGAMPHVLNAVEARKSKGLSIRRGASLSKKFKKSKKGI